MACVMSMSLGGWIRRKMTLFWKGADLMSPLHNNIHSLSHHLFLLHGVAFHRCVAYGVLPEDEAEKVYKKVLKRKKGGSGYAVASASTASSKSPAKKKKKAKVIKDDDADPDMQTSGAQEVGRVVL